MKLIPYKTLLTMTKEAVDKTLAPVRAASQKKKAELEVCKLDEKIATLERDINEVCAKQDISYDKLIDLIDESALLARRKKQFTQIIEELFPE